MDRRDFVTRLLPTVSGVFLLNTLFRNELFGRSVRPIASGWLKELQELCADLRTSAISPSLWQDSIDALYRRVPLEDLLGAIDFDALHGRIDLPDLGVGTLDPALPRIEGMPERYAFIGRIFGMREGRAIIPHGHRNMVSCHRVVGGEFLVRQYDRVSDDADHLFIRPTIEEVGTVGSHSSISDERNNVHWLVAQTPTAYTFDVIMLDLNDAHTAIDNIDIANAERTEGLLRARKLTVAEALKKYGKAHH